MMATRRNTCFIEGFHVQAYDSYQADELHQNACWELNGFMMNGIRSRVGRSDAGWWERPVGQLCLIPPGTRFWTASRYPGKAIQGVWISFTPVGLARLEKLIPVQLGYAVFDDPAGAAAGLLMEWNRALSGLSPGELVFARQSYAKPLMEMLQNAIPCADGRYRILSLPSRTRAGVFVSRLRQFIRQQYMEPIRLADMARYMAVSPSCLSHRYARMTGDTPAALLLRTRIEVAVRLMERGFHPKDIVARTGFCDLPHLTRTFRHVMGQTPGQFRRMHVRRRLDDSTTEGISASPTTAVSPVASPGSEEFNQWAALLGVVQLQRRMLSMDEHVHPCWVLDAFLTPGVGFRERVGGAIDVAHGPGWLRLYRPGQSYWEDSSKAVGSIKSYSVTFFVIRGSEFWQKFGSLEGVVNVSDTDGHIVGLIKMLLSHFPRYWTDPRRKGQVIFQRVLGQLLAAQRIRSRSGVIEFISRPNGGD